jgi:hypothetical protein
MNSEIEQLRQELEQRDYEVARLRAIISEQNKGLRTLLEQRAVLCAELDQKDAQLCLRQISEAPNRPKPEPVVGTGAALLGQRLAEARGMPIVESAKRSAEIVPLRREIDKQLKAG